MIRDNTAEILDGHDVADHIVERAYRDLALIHRLLGDTASVVRAIRTHPQGAARVLDIGCATGVVSKEVAERSGVEVIGVDVYPHPHLSAAVPIVRADATFEELPEADIAYALHCCHHLSERQVSDMIRNVGRYCRRFLIVELVRHWLPMALFRTFMAPLVSRINVEDGLHSIRRSFTPAELHDITRSALNGDGTYRISVAPLYVRQVVDIRYEKKTSR